MKLKQKVTKLSLVVIAVGSSNLALAGDIDRASILDVAEVIVVTGEQPTAQQQTTTTWTISEDEIKTLGAQSLDQILKNVPGVYVRVGGQGTPRVDVRGFKARHVIYLINGVPANGAEDGQFDPSVIPASQIASVTISVGPTSVLYGPGGGGGVINIRTKEGDNAPLLSGHLEGAENDTLNGDVTLAGAGDKWQGLASVSRQQTDGWPVSSEQPDNALQSGDTRLNSDKTITSLFAQGTYWLSDRTQFMANLSYREGDWGKPVVDGTTDAKAKYERVDDYDSHTIQIGMAHQFNDLLTLRGFVYQNQSDVLENRYVDDSYKILEQTQDGRSVVHGGNLQLIADFADGQLLTGSVIAERQSWESVSETIDSNPVNTGSGRGTGSGGGTGSGSSEAFDDASWLYTVAAEYQYQQDALGFILGGALHQQARVVDDESDYSAQAAGYWQALDDTRINLGVARKVRFPSMRNLYSQSSGNEGLEAEMSKHVELSLDQGIGSDTDLNIAGFYTDAQNYIAKDVDGVYQNMGRYQFKGVDVALHNRSIDKLAITFAYSFLDTEDKDAASGLQALEYRPRHQFRLQADYELPFEMRINMNIEHIMGQVFQQQQKIAGQKVLVEQELDDYTLVDLNFIQPILGENLSVYVRATNLLDEHYYQSEALPQAGRQVFFGVNWLL
jgi:outer membrane cobalamin receptor